MVNELIFGTLIPSGGIGPGCSRLKESGNEMFGKRAAVVWLVLRCFVDFIGLGGLGLICKFNIEQVGDLCE